jgi:hypothetical protein
VLAATALLRLWRSDRRVAAAGTAAVLAAGAVAFAMLHLRWYGGLTPYASGSHFVGGELSVVGSDPDYAGRSRRLVGLLVDQEFGLAAWQPAWLLALPALAAAARRRLPGSLPFGACVTAGWLGATFLAATMHGWWFPGRHVVVVLPLAVAVLAWWAGRGPRRLALVVAAGAIGVATYGRLVADGLNGVTTWVVDFDATGDPLSRAWRTLLPSGTSETAGALALLGVWAAVAAALVVAGRLGERAPRARSGPRLPPLRVQRLFRPEV